MRDMRRSMRDIHGFVRNMRRSVWDIHGFVRDMYRYVKYVQIVKRETVKREETDRPLT